MTARPSLVKHLGLAAMAFLAAFGYNAATGKAPRTAPENQDGRAA